ncbi:MAG: hypothetical protein M3R49_05985 [Chloroflexota bacterium]|nr:hypothetical protein [Chloroflexota bacterium]
MKITEDLSSGAASLAAHLMDRVGRAGGKAEQATVDMSEREGMRIARAESPADLILTVAELMRIRVDVRVVDRHAPDRGVGWLLTPMVVGWHAPASEEGGLITVLIGEAAAALSLAHGGAAWLDAEATEFEVPDS